MKKLIIVIAGLAFASMAQAAAISWKTGSSIKPDGSNTAAAQTLNMYVWVFSASNKATWDALTADNIWSTYGNKEISKITGYDGSALNKGGSTGGTASTTLTYSTEATTTYYAAIITTYDSDKDGKVDYYAVNKASGNINTAGTGDNVLNLSKVWGGNSSTTALTWVSTAAPEPTSGLLLLLGMAGLALKRKRA